MELLPRQCDALLDAARGVIRQVLAGQTAVCPPCHDLDLLRPAGCFVSLHDHAGKLRGCVGRLDASEPLIGAVTTASSSAVRDPRFQADPVTLRELPNLEIELSVLSPLRPAMNVLAFEPQNDGIYLTLAGRSGCFLPQVGRSTGWTREQLLSRLCTEKLGLPANAWQQPGAQLHIFNAMVIGPVPFEQPAAVNG